MDQRSMLKEYFSTKAEIHDLETRIKRQEEKLGDLEKSKQEQVLKEYIHIIDSLKIYLIELIKQVELFIQSIPQSEIRMIFRYRYLDDLNWIQVSWKMNKALPNRKYTEDSCRMKHDRYLKREDD